VYAFAGRLRGRPTRPVDPAQALKGIGLRSDGGRARRLAATTASIRRWSHGGERAPHKPLLLLYALGRLQRTGHLEMTDADAEVDPTRLLPDDGPTTQATLPATAPPARRSAHRRILASARWRRPRRPCS